MPAFYIETFGCQMNVADSDTLAGLLAQRGYIPAECPETADLLIVNTCSVRAHAERRARMRIAQYVSLKKSALWVIGCMAERLGDTLKEQIPGVDKVIGATRMEYIAHDIDLYLENAGDNMEMPGNVKPGVCAFIPIMRGCDNYCSYCIVPYVRGREKSVDAKKIAEKAKSMAMAGVKEITLLGQNVNSYSAGDIDFPELLHRINEIEGIDRIRFMTSHPKDCSEELIRTVAELPKLCKHFHLPVQSGSSAVLDRMNRRYARDDYLRKIDCIRSSIPHADITTDVMVGFPGETEDDFRQTVSLLESVRFTSAFMFAYSAREETSAAKFPDKVPENIKNGRLSEIVDIQTKITKEIYSDMEGRHATVLFTQRQSRRDRAWMGIDNGCKRVLVHCDDDLAGMILPVRVVRSTGMTLIGERI